eukprot:1184054-Prorocentrum_minimum.AAC.5
MKDPSHTGHRTMCKYVTLELPLGCNWLGAKASRKPVAVERASARTKASTQRKAFVNQVDVGCVTNGARKRRAEWCHNAEG